MRGTRDSCWRSAPFASLIGAQPSISFCVMTSAFAIAASSALASERALLRGASKPLHTEQSYKRKFTVGIHTGDGAFIYLRGAAKPSPASCRPPPLRDEQQGLHKELTTRGVRGILIGDGALLYLANDRSPRVLELLAQPVALVALHKVRHPLAHLWRSKVTRVSQC